MKTREITLSTFCPFVYFVAIKIMESRHKGSKMILLAEKETLGIPNHFKVSNGDAEYGTIEFEFFGEELVKKTYQFLTVDCGIELPQSKLDGKKLLFPVKANWKDIVRNSGSNPEDIENALFDLRNLMKESSSNSKKEIPKINPSASNNGSIKKSEALRADRVPLARKFLKSGGFIEKRGEKNGTLNRYMAGKIIKPEDSYFVFTFFFEGDAGGAYAHLRSNHLDYLELSGKYLVVILDEEKYVAGKPYNFSTKKIAATLKKSEQSDESQNGAPAHNGTLTLNEACKLIEKEFDNKTSKALSFVLRSMALQIHDANKGVFSAKKMNRYFSKNNFIIVDVTEPTTAKINIAGNPMDVVFNPEESLKIVTFEEVFNQFQASLIQTEDTPVEELTK